MAKETTKLVYEAYEAAKNAISAVQYLRDTIEGGPRVKGKAKALEALDDADSLSQGVLEMVAAAGAALGVK
jgi:hypothetical protein